MSIVVKDHHKQFIERMITDLEAYDNKRPKGHVYRFHKHSQRVADGMKNLAIAMGHDDNMAVAFYWATLPHDIGKMDFPVEIWDYKDANGVPTKPPKELKHQRRAHTTRGVEMVRAYFGEDCDSDPFLKLMIDIMQNHHETLDGKGYLGKTAGHLSKEVRMVCIVDAADGWSIIRPHKDVSEVTPKAVYHKMSVTNAGQFDTDILEVFKGILLCPSKHSLSLQSS
jgi:HD-GYP domain-containing protein (c-di-GMP phosphodiesterase class II)